MEVVIEFISSFIESVSTFADIVFQTSLITNSASVILPPFFGAVVLTVSSIAVVKTVLSIF